MNGYIKLHRRMMEWEWYTDIPVKVLFLHILLKANHAEGRWKGEEIQRGQTVTSIRHLAKETGLSEQQVRTALHKLEKTGELTRKTTNKNTLISVEKYAQYQDHQADINTQVNNQITNKQQTNNKQITTNKKNKKNKKDKKEYHSEVAEVVDYLNMITGRNYSYTSKATTEKISARIREGASVEDMKTVIDKKWEEWRGTDREQYVRPSTLFAPSHFDEYLNQPYIRRSSGNVFIDLLQKKEEEQHDRERNHQSVGDAERLLWSGQS